MCYFEGNVFLIIAQCFQLPSLVVGRWEIFPCKSCKEFSLCPPQALCEILSSSDKEAVFTVIGENAPLCTNCFLFLQLVAL